MIIPLAWPCLCLKVQWDILMWTAFQNSNFLVREVYKSLKRKKGQLLFTERICSGLCSALWKNPSGSHLMLCEHGCPESERMQNLLTICIPPLILLYLSSYLTKPFAVGHFLLRSRKSPAPSLSPHKFHLLVKNILPLYFNLSSRTKIKYL